MQYQIFCMFVIFFQTEKFSVYQQLLLTMEIIDNLMICQVSIDIDKFSITMSCLTYETCGPTTRTCSVSYMRHPVVKGLSVLLYWHIHVAKKAEQNNEEYESIGNAN